MQRKVRYLESLAGYSYYVIHTTEVVDQFYDPFKILEIDRTASPAEIKKKHPDKVSDDLKDEANEKFIQISKAYQALTDEDIRKNWEEYGNPDGQQSIALPAWVVSQENGFKVLFLYGILMAVFMPYKIGQWWSKSKKYTKMKVYRKSAKTFYHLIEDVMIPGDIIEAISGASEFETLITPDHEELKELMSDLQRFADKNGYYYELSRKFTNAIAVKVHTLIYAHIFRVEVPEKFHEEQQKVLEQSIKFLPTMIKIAMAKGHHESLLSMISVSQMIIQALPNPTISFWQLPFLTHDLSLTISGAKGGLDIPKFVSLPKETKQTLLKDLKSEERKEVMEALKSFPVIKKVNVKYTTLGEDNVYSGSVITAVVQLIMDENAPEETVSFDDVTEALPGIDDETPSGRLKSFLTNDAKDESVYCPFYKKEKSSCWWLFLTIQNRTICDPVVLYNVGKSKTVKVQFYLNIPPGKYPIKVVLKNDSYAGLDFEKEFPMTVVAEPESPDRDHFDDMSEDEKDKIKLF
ncbi:hypothetical protein ROZALSC1DRAFT_26454 [Rozella allomycis CSF55]|uniref:Translocation protein Sec63 domain-containing protein n=1 Tax=Rozella allomycis (strain CSF55) TaxID=988480 RepID=A0A075AP08_ROZAC|nr:Translocation protein Sec63 domain-containing protein [Rozella allomycis CSF55]RKP22158.1 hypothetical protein ROZALSC1DRAFT_26454 [Rozella allomycis CSF55]|eukprot:EPZ31735.1 Translocation protein Sec63 domain-containing protein [Rozella allomycis CSF55]